MEYDEMKRSVLFAGVVAMGRIASNRDMLVKEVGNESKS